MVDFLVIGPYGAVTYNNIFPLIRDDTISIGYNRVGEFSDGIRFGNIIWFTSMRDDYPDFLILSRKYVEGEYKKIDDKDILFIERTEDIPTDYEGVMGVPITFLDKWNGEQFDIIGKKDPVYVQKKKKFQKILIKRKIS